MLVAAVIMVVGIATIAVLSHRRGYRLGGVMVLPLLAIYTFREPLSPFVFVVGTAAAWGTLWAVREYTLNHGRRVFLVAVLAGACATVLTAYVLSLYTPVRLPFDDAEVVASIFPGVAAYNLMRLDRADRFTDVGLMVALFVGLMLVGVAGLVYFEGRAYPATPILALPTSDLVTWLGIETRGEPITRLAPEWLSISLLVADAVVYEWVRDRYDLRLAGIVVIPLLALFSARIELIAAVFAVGAMAVFVFLSSIHWLSLLYGRVLLAVSLVLGCVYALAADVWLHGEVPGLTLFFTGLFTGVAAYNLYRVSPRLRSASLRLSAGLFVVFYGVLLVFVPVPPGGLFHGADPEYALVGVLAVALAVREVYRLERSRPPRDAFARASVFANVDVDGADVTDSPLVDGTADSASTTHDSDSGLAFGSASTDETESGE